MGFNCGKEVLKICKSLHLYMRDLGCIRIGARAHVRSYAACARHATSSGAWRVLRSVEPLREHFVRALISRSSLTDTARKCCQGLFSVD